MHGLLEEVCESAIEEFGRSRLNKTTPVVKEGLSRRQRVLAQLKKQKCDPQKLRKCTSPDEEKGLRSMFDDLKKRSKDLQKKERRRARRKESRRACEQFMKGPCGAAKNCSQRHGSGR